MAGGRPRAPGAGALSAARTDGAVAGGAAAGHLALLGALVYAAYALSSKQVFAHLGGTGGVPDGALQREAGFAAVAALALVAALFALRRGRGIAAAVAAMALLAPFAADPLLVPLAAALPAGDVRHAAFLALTIALEALALLAGARARARAAARVADEGASTATTAAPAAAATSSVSRAGRPTARLGARLALLAGGLLLAIGAGEAAARLAGLGEPPYRNPMLIVPGDERRVPLSEVALFRPTGPPPPGKGPSTRWRPYVFLKGWYDRPQWDYFDDSDCVDYVFDRYGLRDHDFLLEKQPGEYRVVAIGDSFTFGIGVQLQDCWTEQLEGLLAERRGGPVQVVNAGFTSGHHPTIYRPWIVKDGVALQPDVLIVGLCLNDMHPGVGLYAYDVEQRTPPLGGKSHLLNALQAAVQGPRPRPAPQAFHELVAREPGLWESTQAALRQSHAVLAAAGIRLVVVPFPMLSGLREPAYPYAPLLQMVADFCDREGIERVDLLPRFLGLQDEQYWVHPTDQHPNDRGHRLIAEGIAEYLERP